MPNAPTRFDVAIVGGSFAGLALALALARAGGGGLRVALLERGRLEASEGLAADPRAFALGAGSRRLIEAIGVYSRVVGAAQPVAGIDITDSALGDALRPVRLSYDTIVDGEAQMVIVPSDVLRRALAEAVRAERSIEALAPCEVIVVERGAGGATLTLDGGRDLVADLVVAADGARSRLREMAGIGVVGGSYGQRGIAVTVGHERDHVGRAVQHFLPAGPFALLPLVGRRSCITWSESEGEARRIMALDDNAFLDEAQDRAGWRLGRLKLEGPRADWPLAARLARSLVARRLALIGDAARSVHPIAGQGVNLGFRDVAALADAISDGTAVGLDAGDGTILARYERWRRSDSLQATAAFSALNALFSNDWTALRTLRGAGLGLADRLPGLKQMLVSEAAGLTGEVPRLLRGEPV
ncbi:MAG: FAD-dependent monooxygenase [Hyphomicrobiaceae bacterium]